MKLIIDIPEEVKQAFDNARNEDINFSFYDCNSVIGKAIRNGIPLEDIIEMIKHASIEDVETGRLDGKCESVIPLEDCFEIIEAYTKGENNENKVWN